MLGLALGITPSLSSGGQDDYLFSWRFTSVWPILQLTCPFMVCFLHQNASSVRAEITKVSPRTRPVPGV